MHLSVNFGSYKNQDGTTLHSPWKLVSCVDAIPFCIVRRQRPGTCQCEHSAFARTTQTDPVVVEIFENEARHKIVKCGSVSSDRSKYQVTAVPLERVSSRVFGLPFTMEDLLPLVSRNNHLIVTGASYNYRDVLMNFVCNLRRLGIHDGFIVAAFDVETYQFGFVMGLPIFLYTGDGVKMYKRERMEYGSEGFKSITKLKSQVVLDIIKLGYDVTWSDSDIVWLQNPLPLLSAMSSDIVVQSNAPWPEEQQSTGSLRINSGFYRVCVSVLACAFFMSFC
jgi:hypothetical protein